MHKDALFDELRRIEREVAEGELLLGRQEALLVTLKQEQEDLSEAKAVLEAMREIQQQREKDRQRLLSLLQP